MGEDNHGIEPESSEQGTFSEKHLKAGSIEQPKIKEYRIIELGQYSSPIK